MHPLRQRNNINTVKTVLSHFGALRFTHVGEGEKKEKEKGKMPLGSEWHSFTHQRTIQLTMLTWNLGSELGDDGGAVAFGCAGAQGEGVRGARIEACEHVGGLVAQLHYLPTLVGEVQLGVKRAHGLVGDLGRNRNKNNKKQKKPHEYSDSGLRHSAPSTVLQPRRILYSFNENIQCRRHPSGLAR